MTASPRQREWLGTVVGWMELLFAFFSNLVVELFKFDFISAITATLICDGAWGEYWLLAVL